MLTLVRSSFLEEQQLAERQPSLGSVTLEPANNAKNHLDVRTDTINGVEGGEGPDNAGMETVNVVVQQEPDNVGMETVNVVVQQEPDKIHEIEELYDTGTIVQVSDTKILGSILLNEFLKYVSRNRGDSIFS